MRSTLTKLLDRLLFQAARVGSFLFVPARRRIASTLQIPHLLRRTGRLRAAAKCLAVAVLIAGTLPCAFSENAGDAVWSGQWRLNRTASHFIGVAVKIQHLRDRYRFDLGGTTITVGDDGKDYPTAPTRSTSFTQTGKHQWLRVHKQNGKTLDTSVFTMADDERSFLIHTVAVDEKGKEHEADEKFLRETPGAGINGTWRSTKAGVNAAKSIKIASLHDHRLRIDFPDQQMFFVTPLDGSAVAYAGARAVPSVRIAVSKTSPNSLRWTDLLSGRPYLEGQYIFSMDGRRLTLSSWHVTSPNEKELAVYDRQ